MSRHRLILGRWRFWLAMVGVATMLAGFLFGYDQGVISGALPLITAQFHLSTRLSEVVTSWVTIGALLGALAAGGLADRFGRRKALITAAILFIVGATIEACAPLTVVAILIIGRLVIGFGVGAASVAAPLYAAEMSPKASRGRFGASFGLAITIGILVADIVDDVYTGSGDWRLMLGAAVIPGLLLFALMLAMPETPRWLLRRGRRADAARSWTKVRGSSDTDDALDEIGAELGDDVDRATWREVFGTGLRKPLTVGVVLAVFHQITGITAIIYYSNEIFKAAGFVTPHQQASATLYAIGCVNVLATFVAVAFVDRLGRRPLLFTGLIGMTLSLTTLGFAFRVFGQSTPTSGTTPGAIGILTLVSLVVFIASFAFSLGPIVWTIIMEIYPNRVRARAASVATAANWATAFLVSRFFLTVLNGIGASSTFWLFAVFCMAGFVWIWRMVPETKGKSLEEIATFWDQDNPVAYSLATRVAR